MEKSPGTRAWIAECRRLLDRCVAQAKKGDPSQVRKAFEIILGLLDHVDECLDDVIFFADDGGSCQVGIDWENVLPAWFRLSSRPRPRPGNTPDGSQRCSRITATMPTPRCLPSLTNLVRWSSVRPCPTSWIGKRASGQATREYERASTLRVPGHRPAAPPSTRCLSFDHTPRVPELCRRASPTTMPGAASKAMLTLGWRTSSTPFCTSPPGAPTFSSCVSRRSCSTQQPSGSTSAVSARPSMKWPARSS
jgi:hypothetical protein